MENRKERETAWVRSRDPKNQVALVSLTSKTIMAMIGKRYWLLKNVIARRKPRVRIADWNLGCFLLRKGVGIWEGWVDYRVYIYKFLAPSEKR